MHYLMVCFDCTMQQSYLSWDVQFTPQCTASWVECHTNANANGLIVFKLPTLAEARHILKLQRGVVGLIQKDVLCCLWEDWMHHHNQGLWIKQSQSSNNTHRSPAGHEVITYSVHDLIFCTTLFTVVSSALVSELTPLPNQGCSPPLNPD